MRKRVLMAVVLCMAFLAAACNKNAGLTDEQYLELIAAKAEQNKNTVAMYVGEHAVTMDELVYFLAYYELQGKEYFESQKAYFTSVYGEEVDFWSTKTSSNDTMAEAYKAAAFSAAAFSLIMYYDALENGIEVSEESLAQIDGLTVRFLNRFSLEERARCGMSTECIAENYRKLLYADAYEKYLTEGQNVDKEAIAATIDREDYRVYETDYLYVSVVEYDENFHRVELSEEEIAVREQAIQIAYERVQNGEDMIQVRANFDRFMTYSGRDFYRTDITVEASYREAAMGLEEGEVTLLETGAGYYIIKMIDCSQVVGYEDAIEDAVIEAEAKDISVYYEEIEKNYEVLTQDAWDAVRLGTFAQGGT